jgi:hypothetical protein
MAEEGALDEIVSGHAKAILTMDIARIMNDLMPEPMMKLQQQAGGGSAVQVNDYKILGHTREGDDYWYDVQYIGPESFTVHARWSQVAGAWKIIDADIIARD